MTAVEKPIEEIKQLARDIFEPKTAIDGIDLAFAAVHGADRDDTHFMRIATHLYGKGYRKASEVVKEIFAEIEQNIGKKLHIDDHMRTYAKDSSVSYKMLAELKKKYESEENKE